MRTNHSDEDRVSDTPLSLALLDEDPDRLLIETEVAPWRGGGTDTLARDRWACRGIPFLRLGRRPVYRAGDVAEWVRGRRRLTEGMK